MNSRIARSRRGAHGAAAVYCAVMLFLASLPFSAEAGLRQSGRWTSKYDFFTRAVNLATLRGNNDTTQVLYWSIPDSAYLWNPNTGGSTAPRRLPASTDIFCSGQSTLSDGRLLVIGGDEMGSIGPRTSEIFDARNRTWTAGPIMADGRYYATGITVGKDTVLAFSGAMYNHLISYGGRTGGSVIDSLQILGMSNKPAWKVPVSLSPALPAREGHAAAYWQWKHRMYTFGGRNGTTVYNDLNVLQYDRYANSVEDSFYLDPSLVVDTTSGNPSRRWRHSMIIYPKSNNVDAEVYVYGGLGQDSTVLSDVWRLVISGSTSTVYWQPVTTSGSGPGPRYGHCAVFDPGAPGTNRPRMLVFGGRSSTSTAPQDSAVYELTLTGAPTWSTLSLRSGSPIPAARESLTFIADKYVRPRRESTGPEVIVDENRIVLWGGRNANGVIPEDKVWMLWLPDSAWAATNSKGPQWQAVTPDSDAAYGRPARRRGMACAYEPVHDYFVYTGGDTTGGPAQDIWAFNYQYPKGDQVPYWQRLVPSYQIGARTGHSLMIEESSDFSKFPEYTNAALTSWTKITTAGHASGRLYPQVFQLPSGRLAMVGEDPATQILNLGTGYYENGSSSYTTPDVFSGSAAMFRPGKILKCGFAPATTVVDTSPKRISFGGASDTTYGWVNTNTGFLNRTCHNMIILPTGEVLITGGTRPDTDEDYSNVAAANAVYRPQLWNPNSGYGAWSDTTTLARDPAMRDYHSTAVLLPDGRVLTAGGQSKFNVDRQSAAIYSPYYIFARKDSTTDSTYATRPAIDDLQGEISYGSTFTVCTVGKASGIGMVSLIKPGASTHGYNSDQRFIPLTFSTVGCSNTRELSVNGPASRFIAPPGSYLLFVVANDSTPAIARWVEVGDDESEAPACLDFCGGGASEMTTGGNEESLSVLTRSAAQQFGEDLVPISVTAGAKETSLHLMSPADGCLLLRGISLRATQEPEGWRACSVDAELKLVREKSKVPIGAWRASSPSSVETEEQPAPVDTVEFEVPAGVAAGARALSLNWRANSMEWAQAPSEIQTRTADGEWTALRTIYAQTSALEQCLALDDEVTQVRVLFRGRPEVASASILEVRDLESPPITVFPDALSGASSAGITDLLEGHEGAQLRLCKASGVSAHFVFPAEATGHNHWFVDVRGNYESASSRDPETGGAATLSLAVSNPVPNPTLGNTTIAFTLSRREHATVRIYSVAGRLVRELIDDPVDAGRHELVWDGLDRAGRKATAGVYFYRVSAGSLRVERKVVFLK